MSIDIPLQSLNKKRKDMLKTIIQTTTIALICLATISCEKEVPIKGDSISEPTAETESSSLDDFTVILSKAVANDKDLRDFIKVESLKQFDKDYDVFYPFVKNERLSSGISFREALLKYTTEDKLEQIESNCPLLNIFVPDWSWINGYSADSWDTNDDFVTVSRKDDGDKHVIYYNGSVYDTVETDGFPSYPVLIVKNNGRLRVSNARTRSSEATYEFTHKEFDNTNIQTRANRKWHYDPVLMPVTGSSDFVPESAIDPLLIKAYSELEDKSIDGACQRDYVYYGMSKSNTDHGVYRGYIREQLYRFKISKGAYGFIADQNDDPKLHETIDVIGRKNSKDSTELYNDIWTEGSFAFQFDIFIGIKGKGNDGYIAKKILLPECARDVYDLSKVRRKYKHQTGLERGHYIYYFNPEDLVPKWIYPENPVYLPEWDISNESTDIYVQISEIDDSETKTYTRTRTYRYTSNFSVDGNISGSVKGVKGSFGVKYGNTKDDTESATLSYTTTLDSEDLGMEPFEYTSNILSKPITENVKGTNMPGYIVSSTSVGAVTITFLPTDIR